MSVLAALTEEHRLFERLVSRLGLGPGLDPDMGHRLRVRTLASLLPALERHDALEERLFAEAEAQTGPEERRARELVDAQHADLQQLRREIARALSGDSGAASPRLAHLTALLADRLKWHFETEEMLLWPLLAKRRSRSLAHSLEREARRDAEELSARLDAIEASLRPAGEDRG